MIKLTYRHLISTIIQQSLQRLGKMTAFDTMTAFRIHKILESVVKERLTVLKKYDELSRFAAKDMDGQIQRQENGEFIVPEEKIPAYDEALETLFNTEFTIPQHMLGLDQLTKVQFSPQEISALEPLIDGLEEAIPTPSFHPGEIQKIS